MNNKNNAYYVIYKDYNKDYKLSKAMTLEEAEKMYDNCINIGQLTAHIVQIVKYCDDYKNEYQQQ